ncbi:hypothetical protein [Desertivirga xinjiangensis]|uniref:hypothetical protein n=1 Tax=Desertivirga xinjiangensis TaxID=539206 RepID=UPI0021090082|nr:hypothetical protein [Pedobacter xinjiangensis]
MTRQKEDKMLAAELTELWLQSRDWTIFLEECSSDIARIRSCIEETDPVLSKILWDMDEVSELVHDVSILMDEMAEKHADFVRYTSVLSRQTPVNLDLLENHTYFERKMKELQYGFSQLKQMMRLD